MDEEALREIREIAERRHMTVSEWVRQALRRAARDEPRTERRRKLEIVESATRHAYPTGDIDEMLSEIAMGRSDLDLPE